MSNFKLCHINSDGIKKVFIFNGIQDDDETFSKQDVETVNVAAYIHKDDSIRRIKEKIYLYCDLNVSISEIYLFALNENLMSLYPFCKLSGPANLLIMPAIHSASISTKMLQELGGGTLVGPYLVGFKESIQIAPLGSNVADIVNLAALSAFKS